MSDWSEHTTRIPELLRHLENNATMHEYNQALSYAESLEGVVQSVLGALRSAALRKKLKWTEDQNYRYVVVDGQAKLE